MKVLEILKRRVKDVRVMEADNAKDMRLMTPETCT